jgi:uncharacterized protein (TIGR03083 family)
VSDSGAGRDLQAMVAAERRRLCDDLNALTDAQWATASLCTGWDCRDVVAHLVWALEHSGIQIFGQFVRAGFNLTKFTMRSVRADTRSGSQVVEALRANADNPWTPPGGFGHAAPLTDTLVHGQDIRRPLGLPTSFDHARQRAVLDFLASKKATQGFSAKGRLDGVALHATDIDWSHGTGAEVRGTAEAIMMAMAGRPAALADLDGEGVGLLRSRI